MNPPAATDAPADAVAVIRHALAVWPQAHTNDRAALVNALARAYLHSHLDAESRAEAEIAMTRALDDPEPRVRRALAHALAGARAAPRHVVVALAGDAASVSRIVLCVSPLLADEDLVEAVATGDALMQVAVARRARVSGKVAAAIAEVGERRAVLALLSNLSAEIGEPSLWRLLERFATDEEARLRFAVRRGLTAALRAAVAAATVEACATEADRYEPRHAGRLARDGREQAFVAIAGDAPGEQLVDLVAWLRQRGHLTVGLFLRALAGGDVTLVGESLAQMAQIPRKRVIALMRAPRGLGFAALWKRAAMPVALLPAFRIAVERAGRAGTGIGVNHGLTRAMLDEIEALGDIALKPVVAKLWRLAAEGARADAREYAALPTPDLEEAVECVAPPLMLDAPTGNENFAPAVTLDLDAEDELAA